MDKDNQFPEAGAVAYFKYKRSDGFEVCLTLRDTTGKTVLERIDGAIKRLSELGATPLPLQNGFTKKEPKPIVYIEGVKCPVDGARVVEKTKKDGERFAQCENRKFDFKTNTNSGCTFISWDFFKPKQEQEPDSYDG